MTKPFVKIHSRQRSRSYFFIDTLFPADGVELFWCCWKVGLHVALYVFAVSLAACVELFQKGGKKTQKSSKKVV